MDLGRIHEKWAKLVFHTSNSLQKIPSNCSFTQFLWSEFCNCIINKLSEEVEASPIEKRLLRITTTTIRIKVVVQYNNGISVLVPDWVWTTYRGLRLFQKISHTNIKSGSAFHLDTSPKQSEKSSRLVHMRLNDFQFPCTPFFRMRLQISK